MPGASVTAPSVPEETMHEDKVIGLALAVLGLAMAGYAMTISAPFASSGDPGPAVVPRALGVLLALLGLLLALRRPRTATGDPDERAEAPPATGPVNAEAQVLRLPAPAPWRQAALGLAFVAFVALFDMLGFTLSAALFLLAGMALLGPPGPAHLTRAAALALGIALALGFILNGLLDLTLPGVWIG